MRKDDLIWAEDLLEEAEISRRAAYAFHSLPFAHVVDGELYYEWMPLGYLALGSSATSGDEAKRNWRLMREAMAARGWGEPNRRADAQMAAARTVARKGRRRKRKPGASKEIGSRVRL
jgi:hypothetical protein